MTTAGEEPVLYREPGSGLAPLLWGPIFALVGFLSEVVLGGPTHPVPWTLIGLALLAMTALWVYARRRFLAVRLTPSTLWQGREPLPVRRIVEVDDVGAPVGATVLGGGWTVPRKYDELPLRLDDDSVVVAWAKDVEALRAALHETRRT
ncbi:hypothetical protein [Amycolatopsis palatopharyngis]|uniref:hypothetical protein n=1 Tax=Amycolatopsis palatopharyngis TaxID=187982 RepID=UPI000E2306F4|nr:hypothetical protein [Amycolatopsis palatopharyngis]